MNRTYLVGGIGIVVVLAIAIGIAFSMGLGPAPGGSDSNETLSEFPTETTDDQATVDESTSDIPPFTFAIDDIETCGQTCRDVTATVTNNQNETATGVTVYSRIFAGQNNTNPDALVWEGKEDVGTLESGGSTTSSRRVELSLLEAQEVNQEDGWITILTTVESHDTSVTFQDSDEVI